MEKELQQLSTALDELHKSNDVSDAAYSTLKFAVLQLKNCNLQNVNGSILAKVEIINALTNTMKVNKQELGEYYAVRDVALEKLLATLRCL